jgi:glycosyltransferase involved in cell wall biosynthesis
VVPAYNEVARIGDLLSSIDKSMSGLDVDYEVVVVDDGSTDGTPERAGGSSARLIVHDRNRGKAAAVQTGLAATTGAYVAVLDADLEYSPSDLLPMLDEAERHGTVAVYGSRYLETSNFRAGLSGRLRILRGQELQSWLANWVLTALVFLLFGKVITDTLTGLKIYPGDFLRAQTLTSTGFEGDHEITARLIRARIAVRELPIGYEPRTRSQGKKIGPRDGLIAVATFLKFRFR